MARFTGVARNLLHSRSLCCPRAQPIATSTPSGRSIRLNRCAPMLLYVEYAPLR
jgi:hypothetical protein